MFATGCGSSDPVSPPAVSIGTPGAENGGAGTQTVSTELQLDNGASEFGGEEFPEVILNTTKGAIRLKLDAKKAPATVDNFLTNYVATGHYNGTIFHYVKAQGMILGGLFDASMNPKETRSEIQNEANNGLKNKRGTIAMSRDPNFIHSSTCQFFINCADNSSFDYIGPDDSNSYGYCVFGEVVDGLDVVDAISQTEVNANDGTPSQPIEILSAERVK
ncbi:peptidylprolyl isomerase [Bremerella cremea]|uniref:Peptidyl-prolyl cis-trans isomerase n=2 Tax=Bremerella cremea TaxID=1031537 RepID=A0A368KX59_9BACT|nr:peptidylprolyl isomerase [Bremerella cremea]